MKPEVAEEVRHLTSDEIEELYRRYLDGEKNKDLVEEYGIQIDPNKLIRVIPPLEHKDEPCPYCQVPMYSRRRSKTGGSRNQPRIECLKCGHCEYSETTYGFGNHCQCARCTEYRAQQRNAELNDKRRIILYEWDVDLREPVPYSSLSFNHKLYLFTLFRMQTDESFEFIQAVDDPARSICLAPTQDMDIEIIRTLFRDGVILVDPNSRISAFVEDEEYKLFYTSSVQWITNVTFDGDSRANFGETFHILYSDFLAAVDSAWSDEVVGTLYAISTEEVMQYIDVKAEELRVDFSAKKKTREIVRRLLDDFSVSEIYYFAKKAVENAHIFYSKGHAKGKKHAANTIPGKMLDLGERAKAEQWNTYKYGRDSRAPRSAISIVYFDLLFQGDDDGFNTAPGTIWEEELLPKYFNADEARDVGVVCKECESIDVVTRMGAKKIVVECRSCGVVSEYLSS